MVPEALQSQGALKVGFVGAGSMAREHARAFGDLESTNLHSIYSRTQSRADALADELGIQRVCTSLDQFLGTERLDLIVIAVPIEALEESLLTCLPHADHLLMEKPVGLNYEAALRIEAAAGASQSQVFVGLNRRHLGSTRSVIADLDPDAPRFIEVHDQQDLEVAAVHGHSETVLENWMYANSIHAIDYFPTLGRGEITEVTRLDRWDSAHPGQVSAHLRFSSGDTGFYSATWNGPGPWAVSISTPDARWEMRPLEKAAVQRRGERSLIEIESDPIDEAFKPGFRRQAEEVVAAMGGNSESRATTLDDGLKTMHLISRIYET